MAEGNPNLSNPNLTGDADTVAGKQRTPGEPDNWATRTHPDYTNWCKAEKRQRASYIATTDQLAQFLVPHDTEGKKSGKELDRAKFGFAIGLNAMFVNAIMGHIRTAEVTRFWGPLSTEDGEESGRPAGGVGQRLWDDATLENDSWENVFHGRVLEWMLSSVGGWLLIDSSERMGRPKLRFFPQSAVEDFGWGKDGLRWIKFEEQRDVSQPRMESDAPRFETTHLLYELDDANRTIISRWDDDAMQVGEDIEVGELVDFQGQPTLPLVQVGFGAHPSIDRVAAGLLLGLDDIVIDAFNQVSEIREAYRDFAFSVFTVKGPEGTADTIEESLSRGSYLLDLGDDENAELNRVQGATPEVDQGLAIIDVALKAWALSARRKSVEAMEGAEARSGVSLKAEFQMDERPLLVTIAERLDDVESMAMFLAAQVNDEGFNARSEEARRIGATHATDFDLEEEPSRISRIIAEYRDAFGMLQSPEALTRLTMRLLDTSDLIDLDAEVEMEGGENQTVREVVRRELEDSFNEQRNLGRAAGQDFGPLSIR